MTPMDVDVCELSRSPAETVSTPSSFRLRYRGSNRPRPPTLIPPLTFYDRHLAEHHRLKNVEPFPQLVAYLHQVETIMRGSFGELDATLSRAEVSESQKASESTCLPELHDAYAAAMAYQATEAKHATILASSLLLHSGSPAWFASVSWEQLNRSQWSSIERNTAFIEDCGLRIKGSTELEKWKSDKMNEESQRILRQMEQSLPALAFWEIFCFSSETETVLKDLGKTACSGHLDRDKCWTNPVPATTPFHLDATTTAWGLSVSSMSSSTVPIINPSRHKIKAELNAFDSTTFRRLRSQRRVQQSIADQQSASNIATLHSCINDLWPNVVIPRRAAATSMADLFRLRAWARAVEHDTTFIIFRCGNTSERIAFRHRSTQTLYISDLIDLSCPSYGRLQTGLYLSIVHDAFERVIQQKHYEKPPSQGTHKNHGHKSGRRYITRLAASMGMKEAEKCKVVKDHADDRSLALLEMRYDVYNSPAPACFVRVGTKRKRSYGPDKYFKLVLTSEIGSGATGVVHDAQLELQVGGHILQTGVVVKLAFQLEEIEGMRHEFSVYEHLTSRGVVEGIPLVFGLFEDVETDAMALVMSHVGRSLWDLRTDPNTIRVKVSASVRDAYLRIMSSIHKAGVRHCDLRPENLMLADDEMVTIIDFDQATINPSNAAKKREMHLLEDLLEGGVLYDSKR